MPTMRMRVPGYVPGDVLEKFVRNAHVSIDHEPTVEAIAGYVAAAIVVPPDPAKLTTDTLIDVTWEWIDMPRARKAKALHDLLPHGGRFSILAPSGKIKDGRVDLRGAAIVIGGEP